MISKNCIPYRPYDYMYDPIFTVSGPTDHYKAAILAKMSSIKFQLCPIYANMFSDLPNRPKIQLVQRRQRPIMRYEEKLENSQKNRPPKIIIDVRGADRAKFFCPIINLPPKDFVGVYGDQKKMPKFYIEPVRNMLLYDKGPSNNNNVSSIITKNNVQVQTMFRDSCAQTTPWEPPYKIIGDGEPEILKLDFLDWSAGQSAGVHEIQLIERARMKRSWEHSAKPDINDENSLQLFRDYVEALERDEWAFREKEIQEIQQLRLHLLEKMLEEIHETSHDRAQQKLERIIRAKQTEKAEKLEKIRKKTARELRKLELLERGEKRSYYQPDIIEEHISKSSELYGPLIRNGEHPKRWHQIIDEKMQKYKAQFIGVEQFSALPRWLDQATNLAKIERKLKSNHQPQLCIRETKWTAPVLKLLHEELKNLRKENEKKSCSLRVKRQGALEEAKTPEIEGISDEKEKQYQAIVFLQSIIEGRATQSMIYEGRENCKELIQELKYSVGLLKKQKELRSKEKLKVRMQQREETIQNVMVSRLQGTLGKLQGQIVGSILDFLNKELRRLLEERKAHAMCWVNERERNIREAAEAGRRQKEIRRRREHDEIFRQIVKVTQESIDVYLHDIITEGMEFASVAESKTYVLNLADKIEKEIDQIDTIYAIEEGIDAEDELVADLVHHFVLPEVEKENARQMIKAQQKQKLKTIHDSIYRKLENLPKPSTGLSQFSYNENSLYSSSPTIEHYQYNMEELLQQHDLDTIHSLSESSPSFASQKDLFPSDRPTLSTSSAAAAAAQNPDVLELYLNMLATQDIDGNMREQTTSFNIQERIPLEINNHTRGGDSYNKNFINDLDTIPETENESSTLSGAAADATTIPSSRSNLNDLDGEEEEEVH